ncbi:beta-hexosaminidase (plasmid) [Arthrobacter sp. StoSoilB3]|nr:beta-hexosaminidase [Arthrobacter sp. StoSoilB3]
MYAPSGRAQGSPTSYRLKRGGFILQCQAGEGPPGDFDQSDYILVKNRHSHAGKAPTLEDYMNDLLNDAYAVLLPAFDGLEPPAWLPDAFETGLQSVLLGESRSEYVNREMTESRIRAESADEFIRFTRNLRELAGGQVLVAVDQEPWGIQRLHSLVPSAPVTIDDPAGFERASFDVGVAARSLGVNMFLSPVVDVLSAPHPWLNGRTLEASPEQVAEAAAAFVRGVQEAGVATVVKHFPGFPAVPADPATERTDVPVNSWNEASLLPFARCIESGTKAVMTGPAPVLDLDPQESASTSPKIMEILRIDLAFGGLVVSDDLDAPATLQGRTLEDTAVASLKAGANLLLVAGGSHLDGLARSIAREASGDTSLAGKLNDSARRVRGLVSKLSAHSG